MRGARHGLRLGEHVEHHTYERDDVGEARKQRRFWQMRSFDPERGYFFSLEVRLVGQKAALDFALGFVGEFSA